MPWESELDPRRFFTPAEADAMLDELRDRLSTLASLSHRARRKDRSPEETKALRDQMKALLTWFDDVGVRVKSVDPPLIDFPALLDGQEVVLSWRDGEDRVEWWHPTHTGLAGREPVDPSRPDRWTWWH